MVVLDRSGSRAMNAGTGRSKIVEARDAASLFVQLVRAGTSNRIEKAAVNGRVTCLALWTIANQFGVKRKEVSTACDTLGIKVRECQLGTF